MKKRRAESEHNDMKKLFNSNCNNNEMHVYINEVKKNNMIDYTKNYGIKNE